MLKNKIVFFFMIAVFALLTGCRASPVLNIEQAPIMTATKGHSMEDISKAIIAAGQSLGWVMKKVDGANEIIGVLYIREHMAKVSIKYTNEFYSIKYLDSANLKYDGTNIHKNYNGWVQNLNRSIQTHLNMM
jgi:hypothetical protein